MRTFKTTAAAAVLLLFGAAGCADLDVTNPNDPTREQALATPGDVESLIAGSFNTWYAGLHDWTNTFWVSNAAFEMVGTPANWGNIPMSGIPRVPIQNDPAWPDYEPVVNRMWQRSYRAIAAISDGLRTLENNQELASEFSADELNRLQAFANFVLGIGHATIAIYYDQGFVVDQTTDLTTEQTAVPYADMMQAASGYFDEAIRLSQGASWTIPEGWMSVQTSPAELVGLIHGLRAQFRAATPRWSSEQVDWQAVLDDLNQASPYIMNNSYFGAGTWANWAYYLLGLGFGWTQEPYFINGMADQSGNFQKWLQTPLGERFPWFGAGQDEDPFLIHTPDTRYPQGATLEAQQAAPGSSQIIPASNTGFPFFTTAEHFKRPARGLWRWSYYHDYSNWMYVFGIDMNVPFLSQNDINLLKAEALLNLGRDQEAADLINITRTAAGLSPADPTAANDGNSSCVPKLPSGVCGDLMEMLKWERRMELDILGLINLNGYWDARRWGDLYKGTPLQWPVPAEELQTLQMDVYTFGGTLDDVPSASPGSSYDWPSEGQ